jgi:hypothetical protein
LYISLQCLTFDESFGAKLDETVTDRSKWEPSRNRNRVGIAVESKPELNQNRKRVQTGSGYRNLVLNGSESMKLARVEIVTRVFLETVAATKSGYRIWESGTHS